MSLHFVAFLRRYKRALNISRRSVFLGLVFFVILSRRERMTENCSSLRSDVYLVMEQLDYNILLRNISILGEWAKDIRQVLKDSVYRRLINSFSCNTLYSPWEFTSSKEWHLSGKSTYLFFQMERSFIVHIKSHVSIRKSNRFWSWRFWH